MITVREGLNPALQAAVARMIAERYPSRTIHLTPKQMEDAVTVMAVRARFFGVYDGDKPIGFYSFRIAGRLEPLGQVHMGVERAYHGRWLTRGIRRHMLSVLFEHQDVARVSVSDRNAFRFVERFGFRVVEDDGTRRVYEMRKDHALSHRCTRRARAA